MNYEKLYFKYKKKYINLKNQIGSGTELDKIKDDRRIKNDLERIYRLLGDSYFGSGPIIMSAINMLLENYNKNYNDKQLFKELQSITISDDEISNNPNLSQIKNTFENLSDYINSHQSATINLPEGSDGFKLLLKQMGISQFIKRESCTVKKFMTEPDVEKFCNNPSLVLGSCGNPSFFQSLYNENSSNYKIIELLNLINEKNDDEQKNIRIILGVRSHKEFLSYNNNNIDLYFNEELPQSDDIDIVLNKINSDKDLIGPYYIKTYFPTNIEKSNKDVLDKILEMTNKFKFTIINKICGSCFRSLYYLVQNSTNDRLTYEVNPLQGLSNQSDSSDIRTCWEYSRKKT
jgi:hypothetical protein